MACISLVNTCLHKINSDDGILADVENDEVFYLCCRYQREFWAQINEIITKYDYSDKVVKNWTINCFGLKWLVPFVMLNISPFIIDYMINDIPYYKNINYTALFEEIDDLPVEARLPEKRERVAELVLTINRIYNAISELINE